MGVEDREWWREAQRKRERGVVRWASSRGQTTRPPRISDASLAPVLKWGHWGVIAFWLAVMGVVYLGMHHYLKPKPLVVTLEGEVRIPRARDGHFYAPGTVHGQPVRFLIDTGASTVTVSAEFAASAGLTGGEPTVFHTANGPINGRVLRGIPVTMGPVSVSGVTVGVGLVGLPTGDGLLGQSFLSKFRIEMTRDELVLRAL